MIRSTRVTARRLLALVVLLSALAGCGTAAPYQGVAPSATTPTVTPSPSPSHSTSAPVLIAGARIVVHSSTEHVPAKQTATVTAQCAAGETLFGGGEEAGYFEQVDVTASYPSAPDAWTVSALSVPSFLMLTVDAYCLQAPTPAIAIVYAIGNAVNCPAGDFVVGGGYRGEAYGAQSSLPDATRSGWHIMGSAAAEVFALCTRTGVSLGPDIQTTFTVPGAVGNSSDGSAICPAGQFATGGGFSGGLVADQDAAPDFTGYGIEVQAVSTARTETVVSVCAHG